MMKHKLTHAEKEAHNPRHLPRHYYPGYVFIPKNGYFQARKIGLTGLRVCRDPRFHKTRLLAKEFARSNTWAKLIRAAVYAATGIKCNKQSLHGLLIRALQQDETNLYGCRQLQQGDLSLLEGFNFNAKAPLEDTCKLEWDGAFDPEGTQIIIRLPSFVPEYFLFPSAAITHCRICLVTVAIDPQLNIYQAALARTSLIPLKRINIPAGELIAPFQAHEHLINIIAVGLLCYTLQGAVLSPSPEHSSLQVMAAF